MRRLPCSRTIPEQRSSLTDADEVGRCQLRLAEFKIKFTPVADGQEVVGVQPDRLAVRRKGFVLVPEPTIH